MANPVGILGTMPLDDEDLILGHSAQDEFPDARVNGFSDWFVNARFAAAGRSMRVSFGHGSPYVYLLGNPDSHKFLAPDLVQRPSIPKAGPSEINHGKHRRTRKRGF